MKREIIQSLIYKILPKVNQVVYTLDTIYDSNIHTYDKFKKGIRVVFFSFQVFQKGIDYIGKLLIHFREIS